MDLDLGSMSSKCGTADHILSVKSIRFFCEVLMQVGHMAWSHYGCIRELCYHMEPFGAYQTREGSYDLLHMTGMYQSPSPHSIMCWHRKITSLHGPPVW